jgi:hypothetical protein
MRIVDSDACGPTISRPIPATLCNASRREMNVERSRSLSGPSSLSSERQRAALDRDVPKRLGDECVDEHRLPRQQVQLAEARGAVPDELVPGRADDRDLAFEDRHER